jgi:two-component sensor histidine kinase
VFAERLGIPVDDVKIAVRVTARHEREKLLVTVADEGIGMTPNPGSPGLRLGIPLITKLCDDVRFSSSDDGTVVSMSFATPGSAGGGQ